MQKFITRHSMRIAGVCLVVANILLFIVEGGWGWNVLGLLLLGVAMALYGWCGVSSQGDSGRGQEP